MTWKCSASTFVHPLATFVTSYSNAATSDKKVKMNCPRDNWSENLHFDLSSFHGKLHTLVVDEIYLHTFGARSQLKCLQRMKCIWQRNLFFNGDNPEVTKLTRNLFKEPFMHHIQIQIEIKKLHRWIYACCSKECFLSCFWDAKIRTK